MGRGASSQQPPRPPGLTLGYHDHGQGATTCPCHGHRCPVGTGITHRGGQGGTFGAGTVVGVG